MGDLSSARGGSPAMTSRAPSRHSDVSGSSRPRPMSGARASCGVLDQPDVVFVDPPDPTHMCPVCDRAMRYPVKLGDCGHRCCSGCLVELVRSVTYNCLHFYTTFPSGSVRLSVTRLDLLEAGDS